MIVTIVAKFDSSVILRCECLYVLLNGSVRRELELKFRTQTRVHACHLACLYVPRTTAGIKATCVVVPVREGHPVAEGGALLKCYDVELVISWNI